MTETPNLKVTSSVNILTRKFVKARAIKYCLAMVEFLLLEVTGNYRTCCRRAENTVFAYNEFIDKLHLKYTANG